MTALLAFLGLLVGALVNHLATDLMARRSLTTPNCPYCGEVRPRRQWLATLAFLAGKHRCPSCDAPIRWRYPLVEIGMAVVFGYLWIVLGPSVKLALYLAYAIIFALVLITDLERRLILDAVMYPAIALAIIAIPITPGLRWWNALLGGAIGFGFFWIAAVVGNLLFGSGALGGGDVTLAAFIGLITGFPLVIEALVLAICIGAALSLLLLIFRIRTLRDHIPYGPFLVIGAVITLMWGYTIAKNFLNI